MLLAKPIIWGHLRCDHECHTDYTIHVLNICFRGLLLNHTSDDEIRGGTLAPLIKKSQWWCMEPSRSEKCKVIKY
jgi:hypothetical protein